MDNDVGFYENCALEELTKEILLGDPELAVGLARYNRDFWNHPLAQDLDILVLASDKVKDFVGPNYSNLEEEISNGEVAYWLAKHSDVNGWWNTPAAQKLEVLSLCGGYVAEELALKARYNRWAEKDAAQDLTILKLNNGQVGVNLARYSDQHNWWNTDITQNLEILGLQDGLVAWELVKWSRKNGWINTKVAGESEIFALKNGEVGKLIMEKNKGERSVVGLF